MSSEDTATKELVAGILMLLLGLTKGKKPTDLKVLYYLTKVHQLLCRFKEGYNNLSYYYYDLERFLSRHAAKGVD